MRVERVRLTVLSAVLLCVLLAGCHREQDALQWVAQAQTLFDFHSNMWVNLHHVLYEEAVRRHPQRDGTLARSLLGPARLTADELARWNAAVAFYDREFVVPGRELLRDDGLRQIKVALTAQEGHAQLAGPGLPSALRDVLQGASAVYMKHWWVLHDATNRQLAGSFATALGKYGTTLRQQLLSTYRVKWPGGDGTRVRVDLVYVADWSGAYTFNEPAQIAFASGPDERSAGWRKLELLLHETSHLLSDPMEKDIDAAAQRLGRPANDLWHAALFFTTGEIVRRTLEKEGIADYVPYAYYNGLFGVDSTWGIYARALEKHWAPYLSGAQDYESALRASVEDALPPQQ